MKRYCLALDLVDDAALIADYERHHREIWPEIVQSIQSAGIDVLDIYRTGNRLFMIIEASDQFSFAEKAKADAANPRVQEWETLMWKFQQALPWAKPGEKWVLMEKIFGLPGPLPTSPGGGGA
ncbi:L-fucose mutarotase [Niastella yeongjuensis]|uniref:L-fucose mutarotase n=1 Tax=Niastella yeongjuensis TaxID=354355 RepID=A0A1V9EYM3_9BACT|nr:L-rhamnose mutarotase [Niastella yeongjuensis]OQP51146.1 L-fucose mutarotase [Niastella yeongjuensis]SEN18563.1 L-rhamnose mutarotase [Niastella yeongjuensis]